MLYNYCGHCDRTSCYGCPYNTWKEVWTTPVVITWNTPSYDSDRYELVEKKDWKIKQLKADIERFKEDLEKNKKDNEVLAKEYNKLIEAIAYAEKELKNLESNE